MGALEEKRILYMGTPEFALTPLEYLLEKGLNIVGLVCRPDAPAGRGHKTCPPCVKPAAADRCIPVFQPRTLKDGAFAEELERIDPDLIVVVAYGMILPKYVLERPRYGCINLHGSLLPKYRGAAPIQRAIMNGEKKTGVCTMFLSEGMDEGDVIDSVQTEIGEDETAGELAARLSALGAPLLYETIVKVFEGKADRRPQNHAEATYAPMIKKQEGWLDFSLPVRKIYNIFRGVTPNPGARARLGGKVLKITAAALCGGSGGQAGEIVACTKEGIDIATGEGYFRILRLSPEGKREMAAAEFLCGRGARVGDYLE